MRYSWFIALALALALRAAAEPQLINGVAVIVNDAIITYQDVREFVGPAMEQQERALASQPLVLRKKQADLLADGTEQLVERQLILHDFKTAGYNLPDSVIDDTIRDRIKQRFGDRASMARTLKAEGVTYEAFRKRTREDIIVEQMRYFHVSKEVMISPQKIKDHYEATKTNYAVADTVKLRMIVLNKPAGADNGATRDLARDIRSKIKEGASFEEMARIHSEGSQRTSGGDWGWVERSVLRKELAEVAFTIAKGTLSEVIDLPETCFLMLVEDSKVAHVKPLSEVRDQIERDLLLKERARLQKQWLDRVKTKSFVRYF